MNGLGRLTGESFSKGSLSGQKSYTYDNRGRQTGVTLAIGSTSACTPPAANCYPLLNTYTEADQVATQTYPTGEVVAYSYSTPSAGTTGWLSSLSTQLGSTTTPLVTGIDYQGAGGAARQVTNATLGSGSGQYTYSATYDTMIRATDIKIAGAQQTLFEQARSFDDSGNVIAANTTLPNGTDNQAFCYDEQNRLTWAGATGTPPCGGTLTPGSLTAAQYQQSFGYDTLGRLTSGPAGAYSYGGPLHGVTAIGSSYTAAYDGAGNMTCRAPAPTATCAGGSSTGAKFTYDSEGRLSTWWNAPSSPSTTVAFLYDNEGNRVEQLVTQNTTTTTSVYVGNVEQVVTSGSSTTTTTYYYASGQRIALAVNGVFSYMASDGLGSATVALNASGSATASLLYAPDGGTRYSSGTMPTDYGFTGQRADATTGLDYYNARYYDPLAGQFTSADRVLPGGGYDILGLSRYAYVHGNPETLTDPSGPCVTSSPYGCGLGLSGEPNDPGTPSDYPSTSAGATASSGSPSGNAGGPTPSASNRVAAINQSLDHTDLLAFAMAAGSILDNAARGRAWETANDAEVRALFPESQGYDVRPNRGILDQFRNLVRLDGRYGRPDWTIYQNGKLVAVVEAGDGQTGYLATKVAKVGDFYVKLARAATEGEDVLIIKLFRVRAPVGPPPLEAEGAPASVGLEGGGIDLGPGSGLRPLDW